MVRSREAQIAELKLAVQEGEERLVKEREAVRKAREKQYEAQRKMEEVEEMMPRLQVTTSTRIWQSACSLRPHFFPPQKQKWRRSRR
jgi:ribosomal protein S8